MTNLPEKPSPFQPPVKASNPIEPLQRVLRRNPWVGVTAGFISGSFLFPTLQASLQGVLGPLWLLGITITVLGAIIGIASINEMVRAPKRRLEIDPHLTEAKVNTAYKGLVVLVSSYDVAYKAIEYHQSTLKRCWLVTTTAPAMVALANRIKAEFDTLHIEIRDVRSQYESEGTRAVVTAIYGGLTDWKLEESEVITDLTGGTKAMTVGAFVACQQQRYPIQYMPSIFDPISNQRLGLGDPIRVEVNGNTDSNNTNVH